MTYQAGGTGYGQQPESGQTYGHGSAYQQPGQASMPQGYGQPAYGGQQGYGPSSYGPDYGQQGAGYTYPPQQPGYGQDPYAQQHGQYPGAAPVAPKPPFAGLPPIAGPLLGGVIGLFGVLVLFGGLVGPVFDSTLAAAYAIVVLTGFLGLVGLTGIRKPIRVAPQAAAGAAAGVLLTILIYAGSEYTGDGAGAIILLIGAILMFFLAVAWLLIDLGLIKTAEVPDAGTEQTATPAVADSTAAGSPAPASAAYSPAAAAYSPGAASMPGAAIPGATSTPDTMAPQATAIIAKPGSAAADAPAYPSPYAEPAATSQPGPSAGGYTPVSYDPAAYGSYGQTGQPASPAPGASATPQAPADLDATTVYAKPQPPQPGA
ncbi:MAG: hypothetical protein QM662_05570 [Gordonia sp. (in: high G+C Gram-positive bacteria)]